LIVVDSSALVAIALWEPDREGLLSAIGRSAGCCLAPINYTETGMVLRQRHFVTGREFYDDWLSALGVVVSNDVPLGGPAFSAFLQFGKGRHPARLNLADCFAYALAKELDAPLLYKGDDFPLTDIRSALDA
jgi:ribonuclease VapC